MAQGAHTTNTITSASQSSSAEDEARQARILQAMHVMRKALSETSKIQLGAKFKLLLHYNEDGTWPTIELQLLEKETFAVTPFVLEVKACDSKSRGLISISLKSGPIFGEVELARSEDFKKIPAILKSAVKEFLNLIKEYVVTKKDEPEIHNTATTVRSVSPQPKLQSTAPRPSVNAYHSQDSMLSDEDMYLEDFEYDNVVQEEISVSEPLAIKI